MMQTITILQKGVSEQLKDLLHLGTSGIGNILKLGSASISSKALTGKNWMVNLLSRKKESAQDIAESYAVYTAASEAEAVQIGEGNTEAAETANTVGDVFIVSVTDEDKNEEVADFSGADQKVYLVLCRMVFIVSIKKIMSMFMWTVKWMKMRSR